MVQEATKISAVLDEIRTRGYWCVVIRPDRYDAALFRDILRLPTFVAQHAVRLRGWEFPQTTLNPESRQIDGDRVSQESKWRRYLEYWRFYQSGQFVDYRAFVEDWPSPGNKLYLELTETVVALTEIFEFAARIAVADEYGAGADMHINVTTQDLTGRTLVSANPERELHATYIATINELPLTYTLPRDQVIADARRLALKAAREVFSRFDADFPEEVLSDIQAKSLR